MQSVLEKPSANKPVQPEAGSPKRDFSLNLARAYAIVLVIIIHTTGPYLIKEKASSSVWGLCCIFDSFSRCSVPIFLMISGLLLLSGESMPVGKFLSKRLPRVVVPLVVWSAAYLIYFSTQNKTPVDIKQLLGFLTAPVMYHLTYLYYLTGLYLAVPILKPFVQVATKQELLYFVALWSVAVGFFPYYTQFLGGTPPISFVVATGFTGYFVLGYMLRGYEGKPAKNMMLVAGACACVALIAAPTYVLSKHDGFLNEQFFSYTHPLVIIYSAVTFMLLRGSNAFASTLNPMIKKAVESLSAASFTIYLFHPILLDRVSSFVQRLPLVKLPGFIFAAEVVLVSATLTLICSWMFYKACRIARIPTWLVP